MVPPIQETEATIQSVPVVREASPVAEGVSRADPTSPATATPHVGEGPSTPMSQAIATIGIAVDLLPITPIPIGVVVEEALGADGED